MKILELKLLVNGYKENLNAVKDCPRGKIVKLPYPMCAFDTPYISVLKVQIDDRISTQQVLTSSEEMSKWNLELATLKHIIYFELMDSIFALERLDFNEQATKILGDTIECI